MSTFDEERSEATVFFLDQIMVEMHSVLAKPPVKNTMKAYISAWLSTLENVKSLNTQ